MLLLVLLVVVPVAVVFAARRLAGHPMVLVGRDLAVSVFLVGRFVYRAARLLVRFIVGEVRSWQISRSSFRA
ncbi:hypothetical protein KGA66_03480 [Actinocrinis puniceicyclus]|uniref:Uncharacterized protein n=1 Tax=Actinocrinis puniceicyclus TaxID=977794 RepID=A0A8J8BB53_9ACTN|nr:hypothetical protein [Actinocrinis puniceicyclus]MBS2962095.1 hypothetical protein [Actinocrinis puniceicyclus]